MGPTASLVEVELGTARLDRFKDLIAAEKYDRLAAATEVARKLFAGRTVWNVNSTATGGGVAEMLRSLIGYVKDAGVDGRWLVIPGNGRFFQVTKRIHNRLHGSPGDGGPLDAAARHVYESTLESSAEQLRARLRSGDVVVLHDPQTAGLLPALCQAGAHVVWRCHIGVDEPNEMALGAQQFLMQYLTPAEAYVFSRARFAFKGLDQSKVWVVPPSIDSFSLKNEDIDSEQVLSVLRAAGLLAAAGDARATFRRMDGSQGSVVHRAHMVETAPMVGTDRLVVQVSRWDRLKDPIGVMEGFVREIAPRTDAKLVLAGPEVTAVTDDPEGAQLLSDCRRLWGDLPEDMRSRVHLALLPMEDVDENAMIVNALQRHAEVVVQKSLAEGFGLTVAEAMWKARPVVASRVGGIQDQIEDGRSGLLINDPRDLAEYGARVVSLLNDPKLARRFGEAARQRVCEEFLAPRHLLQYCDLIGGLIMNEEKAPRR